MRLLFLLGAALIFAPFVHADVLISDFTSSTSGTVPASGGGATKFLRADKTWAVPAGGGASIFANVQDYGAQCDGVTDNAAAIQAAIDDVEDNPDSGVVFIPACANVYCVHSNVYTTRSTVILGESIGNSVLSACGVDTAVLQVNGGYGSARNLSIYGKGSNNDTGTFGAGQSALIMGSNCVHCLLSHVATLGGKHALEINSNDMAMEYVTITAAYGNAALKITTGMWMHRIKIDHSTPTATPAAPFNINAWAASTAYSAGTIVSTQGYLIQCVAGGTSGSAAPALKNYELDIADGSVTWQLVSPVTYYGVLIDHPSGITAEITGQQIDISGFYTAGLAVINSGGGTAPSDIKFDQSILGGAYYNQVLLVDGANVTITNSTIGGCLSANCQGVVIGAGWDGIVKLHGNLIVNNPTGIEVGGGINTILTENHIYGSSNAGVNVNPDVSNFIISNNMLGSHPKYGANVNPVRVSTGASNNYVITGNVFTGATNNITDNGSGSNKVISNNLY